MKEIIQKAIEGGYEFDKGAYVSADVAKRYPPVYLLDPLFWQALGKAMGWGEDEQMYVQYHDMHPIHFPPKTQEWKQLEGWQYQMHRFIDHLASGGDAESFFKELMK